MMSKKRKTIERIDFCERGDQFAKKVILIFCNPLQ